MITSAYFYRDLNKLGNNDVQPLLDIQYELAQDLDVNEEVYGDIKDDLSKLLELRLGMRSALTEWEYGKAKRGGQLGLKCLDTLRNVFPKLDFDRLNFPPKPPYKDTLQLPESKIEYLFQVITTVTRDFFVAADTFEGIEVVGMVQ